MKIQKAIIILLFSVLAILSGRTGADECHKPEKDIGSEIHLAADICTITEVLQKSPPDYEVAMAIYQIGYQSKNLTLESIATGEEIEGSFAEKSAELRDGNKDWMHDMLLKAFEGESMTETQRYQVILKLLQSSVLGHRMFSNLEMAKKAAEEGNSDLALEFVERAMADFFGSESVCSIFENGQARGIEYGVMEGGVSKANYEIVEYFKECALLVDDAEFAAADFDEAVADIEKYFVTIYLQSGYKYATEMIEGDDPEKAQAEGYAYTRAIAALIKEKDPKALEAIEGAFSFTKEPSESAADIAKSAIEGLLEEFGIDEAVFGSYSKSNAENYSQPEALVCEAVNPFSATEGELQVDADR